MERAEKGNYQLLRTPSAGMGDSRAVFKSLNKVR